MPIFFTGNYIKVVDTLELGRSFYEDAGKEEYIAQISRDSSRTAYVSFTHTVDEMKKRLIETQHLEKKNGPFSFTQGDHDGAVFIANIVTTAFAEADPNYDAFHQFLRFVYTDDTNRLCGFTLSSLRDDTNPAIPVAERSQRITISMIQNVNLAPENRQVLVITQHSLLSPEAAAQGEQLEAKEINEKVSAFLNAKGVSHLLQGLVTNNSVSLNKLQELNERIKTNQNVDNRDIKLALIYDLYPLWIKLSLYESAHSIFLRKKLYGIIQQAIFDDIDFFKSKTLEDIAKEVEYYQNHLIFDYLPPLSTETLNEINEIKEKGIACMKQDCLERTSAPALEENNNRPALEESSLKKRAQLRLAPNHEDIREVDDFSIIITDFKGELIEEDDLTVISADCGGNYHFL